jgi:hypothetical protein
MVNHKVRHLEQSFVALKIRVRVEMTFGTQFARAPTSPLGKREDYSPRSLHANCFIAGLFHFRKMLSLRTWGSGVCGFQVFRTEGDVAGLWP